MNLSLELTARKGCPNCKGTGLAKVPTPGHLEHCRDGVDGCERGCPFATMALLERTALLVCLCVRAQSASLGMHPLLAVVIETAEILVRGRKGDPLPKVAPDQYFALIAERATAADAALEAWRGTGAPLTKVT